MGHQIETPVDTSEPWVSSVECKVQERPLSVTRNSEGAGRVVPHGLLTSHVMHLIVQVRVGDAQWSRVVSLIMHGIDTRTATIIMHQSSWV